jgi:2-polyprenyl-6-methoxyphenol hydroxylase-like FAD-dependent oxidoreductase
VTEANPVLIVGAGPVGLVLACDLLGRRIPVRIIDAAPSSTVHSRAVIMWPRSLELLRRVGIADELAETGKRIDSVSYYSGSRRLGAIAMSRLANTPYPFGLCTPQWQTEEVIRHRLVELGGRVETEVALVDLNTAGERPIATLAHPDGTKEQVEADWLVGADGSHSKVRELLGIDFLGEGSDILFAICDAPLEAALPPDEMLYCYRDGGAMGIAPFGDGAYRVACAVPVWNDEDNPPRELFQDHLNRVVPFRTTIGEPRWTTVFRARRRTAATFRSGRCFLVGDAAHIFSAAGSQGMNTGIQDAVNLGWRLGGVKNRTLHDSVLDGYDPERRHSAERVSLVTAKQTSWGLIKKPVKVAARDALVGAAQLSGVLQRIVTPLMSQLTVNYADQREDAKADIRWTQAVRVGERLPVFAGDGGAWPSIADDRLSVLLWAGDDRDAPWYERCARVRDELPATVPVQDVSGWPALAPFLGRRPVAVVVRPDGHVAAVESTVEPDHLCRVLTAAGAVLETTSALRSVPVAS